MSLPNVHTTRRQGLGRRSLSTDAIMGLVCGGVATTGAGGTTALALGTSVQLNSILDAQGYGLTDAYDAANSILVYHHIKRFFKRCPSGTLYLMLVPQRIAPVSAVGATAAMAVTTAAAASDTFMLHFNGTALLAAPLTLSAGSLSVSATALVAAVNAYTSTSGYSASNGTGGSWTLNVPASLGAAANGLSPVIATTGSLVVTGAAATGGVTGITGGAVGLSDMVDLSQPYGAKLLRDNGGKIKHIGFVLNPDATALAAETASTGISDDLLAAIPLAQGLADYEYAAFRPVDILLEGRKFNGTATNAPDLRTNASGQVSVVIGSDPAILSRSISSATPYQYYAAVGDALGCLAQAPVDMSIGATALFNLTDQTDATDPAFVTAALSSGLTIDNYAAGVVVDGRIVTDLDRLYDKGYILPRIVAGLDGIYWGGAPTCTGLDQDDAWVEDSRTLNKATRILRQAFVTSINGRVKVNSRGQILATTVAKLQADAEARLDTYMTNNDEISGRKVVVHTTNPDGTPINFVQSGEVIPYTANIQINGVARDIDGTISLVSSL